jgi:hypothetical protein
MKPSARLVTEPSSFSKFNGLITLNRKRLGNEKIAYDLSTLPFSLASRNLEDEIFVRGVELVTSQFVIK